MAENVDNPNTTDIIVQTANGTLRGCRRSTIYDDRYCSFERVPYAQPPLGELRFKAPVAAKPWTGVLDCTQKAEKALQKNRQTQEVEGSEDCLYLNVYAKKLTSDRPLPVLVYIHGGGFENGDATRFKHAPDYFMMKDVVLVSVAYRLGALGFLSLTESWVDVPGNAGLKDQLLALRWLQENVASFNGDPKNITLIGESAGAGSVHYLMLAPQAEGLFHKAILLSGTVLCRWALQPLTNLPRRLAVACGLSDAETKTDVEVLEFLCRLPAADLVRPSLLTHDELQNGCYFTFGPVVEPYITENCILPRKPKDLLAKAWGNAVPTIMSGTSEEGLMVYGVVKVFPDMMTILKDHPEFMLPWDVREANDLARQRKLAARVSEAHFSDRTSELERRLDYCEYKTYKIFWHPIFESTKARLNATPHADTYLMRFSYSSPTFNHHRTVFCGQDVAEGAAHADDLSYLFYGEFSWKLERDTTEFKTIERMIGICTAFAVDGNPNCPEIANGTSDCWSPLCPGEDWKCLNVNQEVKVMSLPEMPKLRIWESLYEPQ